MTADPRPPQRNPSWGLVNDYVENYAFWDEAFTPEECDKIIEHAKSFYAVKGMILSPGENGELSDIRDSNIVFLSPDGLEWVYQKLTYYVMSLNEQFFKFDLWGFAENLQFTQYVAPTGKYDSHIDKAFQARVRKLSIVLQLSEPEDYDGGDLELLNSGEEKPEKMRRDRGHLIVFPSYTLHRVTPITRGVRNSLVSWITGKPFT